MTEDKSVTYILEDPEWSCWECSGFGRCAIRKENVSGWQRCRSFQTRCVNKGQKTLWEGTD